MEPRSIEMTWTEELKSLGIWDGIETVRSNSLGLPRKSDLFLFHFGPLRYLASEPKGFYDYWILDSKFKPRPSYTFKNEDLFKFLDPERQRKILYHLDLFDNGIIY